MRRGCVFTAQQEVGTRVTPLLPIQGTRKFGLGCTLSPEVDYGPGSHWTCNQQAQTWLKISVILKKTWLKNDKFFNC